MFDATFHLHRDPHDWVEHPSALQSIDENTSEFLRQDAELCKVEALKAQKLGDKERSATLDRRAKNLENLLKADGMERFENLLEFVGDCSDKMPLLHWCASQGDSFARGQFEMIIKDSAIRLTHMARGGSPSAIGLLADLAHSFTKVINEIAEQNPQRAENHSNYATPCIYTPPGSRPQVVVVSWRLGATGVDAATGQQLWQMPLFAQKQERAIGSPSVSGEYLIVNCAFTGGPKHVVVLKPGKEPGIGWALALVSFPYAAVPLYWIFGRSKFIGYRHARAASDYAAEPRRHRGVRGAGTAAGGPVARGPAGNAKAVAKAPGNLCRHFPTAMQ